MNRPATTNAFGQPIRKPSAAQVKREAAWAPFSTKTAKPKTTTKG